MFEIHNAVGNEDSRLSDKETPGTDDIVLKRFGVRRCYGLGSGEGRHTENVAGDMRTYWGRTATSDFIAVETRPREQTPKTRGDGTCALIYIRAGQRV